jgi:uncharacterized protein YegL
MQSTDINLILDASGSMGHLIADTVTGVNAFIKEQQASPEPAFVTLTTFDVNHNRRYWAKPLVSVPALTDGMYGTYFGGHGGGTALLKAVSDAIDEYEGRPVKADKALFLIVTDGEENSSTGYTLEAVRAKIKACEEKGYAFVFLGANDSAWQGNALGATASATYNATPLGTQKLYQTVSASTRMVRSSNLTAAASSGTANWDSTK